MHKPEVALRGREVTDMIVLMSGLTARNDSSATLGSCFAACECVGVGGSTPDGAAGIFKAQPPLRERRFCLWVSLLDREARIRKWRACACEYDVELVTASPSSAGKSRMSTDAIESLASSGVNNSYG